MVGEATPSDSTGAPVGGSKLPRISVGDGVGGRSNETNGGFSLLNGIGTHGSPGRGEMQLTPLVWAVAKLEDVDDSSVGVVKIRSLPGGPIVVPSASVPSPPFVFVAEFPFVPVPEPELVPDPAWLPPLGIFVEPPRMGERPSVLPGITSAPF